MENQNEIMEVVEQKSSKRGLGKLALVVTGIAASVGAVIFFWRRKKAKQQDDMIEVSEDSTNESSEN